MNITKLVVVMVCASLALTSCGRSSKSSANVTTVSTGQQLTDLKTAYDAGAMTEKEYEAKRQELLKG